MVKLLFLTGRPSESNPVGLVRADLLDTPGTDHIVLFHLPETDRSIAWWECMIPRAIGLLTARLDLVYHGHYRARPMD